MCDFRVVNEAGKACIDDDPYPLILVCSTYSDMFLECVLLCIGSTAVTCVAAERLKFSSGVCGAVSGKLMGLDILMQIYVETLIPG